MRRALAILKYLPAVLCGLVVVAWVVNPFYSLLAVYWRLQLEIVNGNISAVFWDVGTSSDVYFDAFSQESPLNLRSWTGRFWLATPPLTIKCPLPVLLTLLLPLAIGALNRFRFPLWSWFAFTALLALGVYLGQLGTLAGGLLFIAVISGVLFVHLVGWPPAVATVAMALLDIGLVLVIFEGDIKVR